MRNILMIIIASLLLLGFAGLASAESYTIRKGDTLSAIAFKHYRNAKRLQPLLQANPKIKNPNLIKVGWKLNIPKQNVQAKAVKAKSGAKLRATSGTFDRSVLGWRNPGGEAFGKRDHIKALGMIPEASDEFKRKCIENYINNVPYDVRIEVGTEFVWMTFGDYKWRPAIWLGKKNNPESLPGLARPEFEHDGKLYQLVVSVLCNNLGIITRPKPEPPKEVVPPVVPAEPAPPAPPIEEKPPVVAPPAPPAPPQVQAPCWNCEWTNDHLANAFGGVRWGIQSDSEMWYYGTNYTWFPYACKKGDSRWRVGPTVETVGWTGSIGSNEEIRYRGHTDLYGARAIYDGGDHSWDLSALYGWKTGHTSGNWGRDHYDGRVVYDRLQLGAIYDQWGLNQGSSWFNSYQAVGATNLQVGGGPERATMNGKPVKTNDRADHEFTLEGTADVYTTAGGTKVFVRENIGYANQSQNKSAETSVGVKLWDNALVARTAVRLNNTPGMRKDDTWGFSLETKPFELLKMVVEAASDWASKNKEEVTTEATAQAVVEVPAAPAPISATAADPSSIPDDFKGALTNP